MIIERCKRLIRLQERRLHNILGGLAAGRQAITKGEHPSLILLIQR